MDDTWDHWRQRLQRELEVIVDGAFVVLTELDGPPVRRGLLRKARPEPVRYVQFLRVGDTFEAECVGARSFGGYYNIDQTQHDALCGLGWEFPDRGARATWGAPNYRRYAKFRDAAMLARLAIDSLAVLHLRPDAGLRLIREH